MNIVHLFASPFDSGPAETIVQLALAQRALGHSVAVACDQKRTDVPAEALVRPRLEALGLQLEWKAHLSVKSGPFQLARDASDIRALNADIVHCHFSHDHMLARLSGRRGLVRSIHAPRSLSWSTPAAQGFTVPMTSMLNLVPPPNRMVLPALVDAQFKPAENRSALKQRLGLPDAPVVGMVSTFQPSRRHEVGLQAFALLRAKHPKAHLALIGDGSLLEPMKARATELALAPHVTFAGYQSGPKFIEWLQACDEVWVLGLGNDFAARAAAQARACEVRVVAVDEGALGEYADALVTPDAASVAAQALGSRAQRPAALAVTQIAQQVIGLYEAVLR